MDATCKDCLIYCNCGKNASSQLNFLYPVGKVIFRLFCPRTRNDSLRKQCTRSPLVTLKCCCLPGISEKRTKFGNLIRHFSQTWSLGYSQNLRMLIKFFRSEDSCYIELDHLVSVRVWIQGTNRLLKNLYVYVENVFSVSALSHGKKLPLGRNALLFWKTCLIRCSQNKHSLAHPTTRKGHLAQNIIREICIFCLT